MLILERTTTTKTPKIFDHVSLSWVLHVFHIMS